VRRKKDFSRNFSETPPEKKKKRRKKEINDGGLVFCILLRHTPPLVFFLQRYCFRTPVGRMRNKRKVKIVDSE
jgi:hypothetical protein